MGVGTNLFPMQLEQRDELAKLVSADELAHIEAFPTVLRLLQTRKIIDELEAMSKEEIANFEEMECCRLLGPDMNNTMKSDNNTIKLVGENFWIHLNHQVST